MYMYIYTYRYTYLGVYRSLSLTYELNQVVYSCIYLQGEGLPLSHICVHVWLFRSHTYLGVYRSLSLTYELYQVVYASIYSQTVRGRKREKEGERGRKREKAFLHLTYVCIYGCLLALVQLIYFSTEKGIYLSREKGMYLSREKEIQSSRNQRYIFI